MHIPHTSIPELKLKIVPAVRHESAPPLAAESVTGKARPSAFRTKSGILSEGELTVSDEGVPQGSLCSPIFSNIVAHYVIDEWLEDTVKPLMKGNVRAFRYADDLVICCR